jgi:hypothetical protein
MEGRSDAQQFLPLASGVKHANDFDLFRRNAVEDEPIPKTGNRADANFVEPAQLDLHDTSELWRFEQSLIRFSCRDAKTIG